MIKFIIWKAQKDEKADELKKLQKKLDQKEEQLKNAKKHLESLETKLSYIENLESAELEEITAEYGKSTQLVNEITADYEQILEQMIELED